MQTNFRTLAQLIPAKHRRLIVENNLIYKAIPQPGDLHMESLRIIWATCIEPNGNNDPSCNTCLNRILGNFRELETTLVEMVREDNLLDL
jgi:hypothetical protein